MKFEMEPFKPYEMISILLANRFESIRMILLDLDETLVSHKNYVMQSIFDCLEIKYGLKANRSDQIKIFNQIKKFGTKGILDFVTNQLYQTTKISDFLSFLRSESRIPADFVRPGTRELLTDLGKKYRLAICTNGNPEQQTIKMKHFREETLLNIPVYYCNLTSPKPSPECLVRALDNIEPKYAIYVGDQNTDEIASLNAKIEFHPVDSWIMKSRQRTS